MKRLSCLLCYDKEGYRKGCVMVMWHPWAPSKEVSLVMTRDALSCVGVICLVVHRHVLFSFLFYFIFSFFLDFFYAITLLYIGTCLVL